MGLCCHLWSFQINCGSKKTEITLSQGSEIIFGYAFGRLCSCAVKQPVFVDNLSNQGTHLCIVSFNLLQFVDWYRLFFLTSSALFCISFRLDPMVAKRTNHHSSWHQCNLPQHCSHNRSSDCLHCDGDGTLNSMPTLAFTINLFAVSTISTPQKSGKI